MLGPHPKEYVDAVPMGSPTEDTFDKSKTPLVYYSAEQYGS